MLKMHHECQDVPEQFATQIAKQGQDGAYPYDATKLAMQAAA